MSSDKWNSWRLRRLAAVFVLLFALSAAVTCFTATSQAAPPAASSYACPSTIRIEERWVDRVDGWIDDRGNVANRLERFSVFDGPPSEMADLVPDGVTDVPGGKQRTVWTLAPHGRSYWMVCSYSGTRVVLQRELKASIKSCWAEWSAEATSNGRPQITGAACNSVEYKVVPPTNAP